MNPRYTAIVLIVLAALGAYIYYYQSPAATAPTPTPTPDTSVKLLDLNAEEIVGLQVSNAVSRTVLRKDGANWFVDEPKKDEADPVRLTIVVGQLAKLKATRALSETPSNLQPFGLVTGTLVLTLTLKDNKSEVIRFGNPTVQSGISYAQRVGDAKVYLVGGSSLNDAQQLLALPPVKPPPLPTPAPPLPAPTTDAAATPTPKP